MSFQFENQYVMTKEMLREYISRVICRGLMKHCIWFSGLCALLCLAAIRFSSFGIAAVLGAFAVMGISAGLSLPFLTARQLDSSETVRAEATVVQFGERILLTEGSVRSWYDYSEITAVQVFRTFSVLRLGKGDAIVLAPEGFSRGDDITFWRFFREKRPDLWAKIDVRKKSGRAVA
ncbi:MAG: hypothetical protein HFF90_13475 [Oscillibacter sp.]|nr:hypothetical protein [Oscillibacter sp.]